MGRTILLTNNETLLLEGLKNQDPSAQKMFFHQNEKKMLAICFRYLRNEEDAFDALHRSFLKIFDKIHQYKAEAKLETWVSRVTINTCINCINANKKYRNTFIQTDEFIYYGEPDLEEDSVLEWWDAAMSIPSKDLFKLIEELPPATSLVFNLYAVDEFKHGQIAEKLNISIGTSKWHLSNARSILKEKIKKIISSKTFDNGRKESEKY
jgi:RNA polymerase sigma-70 factor (ECF subfamily)